MILFFCASSLYFYQYCLNILNIFADFAQNIQQNIQSIYVKIIQNAEKNDQQSNLNCS
jgi:hypothetical protein